MQLQLRLDQALAKAIFLLHNAAYRQQNTGTVPNTPWPSKTKSRLQDFRLL